MDKLLKIYIKKENNIFQSDVWEDYQKSLGRETFRIDCNDDHVLLVKLPLFKSFTYLYCPRAPQTTEEGWRLFLNRAREVARNEKAVFVRVEPFLVPNGILKKLNFKPLKKYSPVSQQYSPMDTLLLDLAKSEEDLLSEMKPKWRYNIKVAERKDVKIRKSRGEKKDVEAFYRLSQGMQERGFYCFDCDHYQKLFDNLNKTKNIELFIAEHNKEIIAGIMVLYCNDNAIYLHGASGDNKRDLMPNHLLQWTAINEAKARGALVYDFWGIAPEKAGENHSWAGITRFKLGFGGERARFIGAFDYTFSPFWYIIFCLANFVRKMGEK